MATNGSPTVAIYDTCWSRDCAHAKDSEQVELRVGIFGFGRLPAQDQQVVAEDADELARDHICAQTLHLN